VWGSSVVLLLAAFYLFAGYTVYLQLATLDDVCVKLPDNTPASFQIDNLDTEPYHMPDYEPVQFASTPDSIQIDAWYIPAESDRAVIVVHGLGSCKKDDILLLAAGMLNRSDYQVLMIDMRDHGASTRLDGRHSGGLYEYQDVLAAWQWLQDEKELDGERIGLFGVSFGGATSMIAYGNEPAIATLWQDSGYGNLNRLISDNLQLRGFPAFLAFGGQLTGSIATGENLFRPGPLASLSQDATGRPIFIVHGEDDSVVPVSHAFDIATVAAEQDMQFDLWIARDRNHAQAILEDPATYEDRLLRFFAATLPE
jgi:fermentation-respiration switch protein FrsA (DUF1100 family)